METPYHLGPNHRPGCNGQGWTTRGSGYNRVRVCPCGAEDHYPSTVPDALGLVDCDDTVVTVSKSSLLGAVSATTELSRLLAWLVRNPHASPVQVAEYANARMAEIAAEYGIES